MSSYILGNVIRLSTVTPFTDQETGDPFDPPDVEVLVWKRGITPDLADAEPATASGTVGMFHHDVTPDSEGVWHYRFFTTADSAADEGYFTITSYLP